jgi:hypothetical protein
MFPVLPVQQFFDELHALEVKELRVLFLPPVKRGSHSWTTHKVDLPSSRREAMSDLFGGRYR